MSVLDLKNYMTLADLRAEIHHLNTIIADKDKEIADLKEKLYSERAITHNTLMRAHSKSEFCTQYLGEELLAWRSLGARILGSIQNDPDWKRLSKLIYSVDEDDPATKWELDRVPIESKNVKLRQMAVRDTIDRAESMATELLNREIEDQRKWIEERHQKEMAKLDKNPL